MNKQITCRCADRIVNKEELNDDRTKKITTNYTYIQMLELRERNEKKRERLKIKHERRELVQSPYLQTVLILQPTNNDDDDNNGNKRYCYSFV